MKRKNKLGKLKKGTLILIICALAVIIVLGIFYFKAAQKPTVKEINIQAFRFGYDSDTVTVNNGDIVRLKITNVDTRHGIRIPALNLQGEALIEFTANTTGEFDWYCLIPCGTGHMQMKGKLVVK